MLGGDCLLSPSLECELSVGGDAPCSDVVKSFGQGSRSVDALFALRDHDPDEPEWVVFTVGDFDLGLCERADIQMERPLEPRPATIPALTRRPPAGTLQPHLA